MRSNLFFFTRNTKIHNLSKFEDKSDVNIEVKKCVKNIGVSMDDALRFTKHICKTVKIPYVALKMLFSNYHILNFKLRKNVKIASLFILNNDFII